MRVYGRTYDEFGNATWNVVETDPQGNNEYVYLTWMVQVLKLVLGAVQSVVQQIFPDFYVAQVQTQFQQYFASLIISKVPGTSTPTYNVNVLFYNGTQFQATIST
jgi:hypothetical protein